MGAYLKDLVFRLASISVNSGDIFFKPDVYHAVDANKYARDACSSLNIACNSFAMKFARGEAVDEEEGI